MMRLIIAATLAASCAATQARIPRSEAAKTAFVKMQACPATGLQRLPCPGFQIDHKVPLKCHGSDTPDNLQWLSTQAHKDKTRREAKHCAWR